MLSYILLGIEKYYGVDGDDAVDDDEAEGTPSCDSLHYIGTTTTNCVGGGAGMEVSWNVF